ncbi:hypothetical protein [Streptomyces sp. NPDC058326]|uniref:hypothetical protein n=1 Tax=Streptomyces sp. NPDC058326 TaxID=3346447 RepID=UPI0036F04D97
MGPQRAADVLDDLDLGAAGVGEADGFDSAFAGDVDTFAQDAHGGEEGAVDPAAVGVDAACELADRLAAFGHEVVPAQPRGPDPVRRDVAAGLEVVEAGIDQGGGQLLRLGEGARTGLGGVQLGGGLRELGSEGLGLLDPVVEGHDGLEVVLGGVLQQRGLEQCETPSAQRFFGDAEDGVGVTDLQDIDLETGEDLPGDRLRQAELVDPLAVDAPGVAFHRGDHDVLAALAGARGGEDAGGVAVM